MGKNRDTHDPDAVLPESLFEELGEKSDWRSRKRGRPDLAGRKDERRKARAAKRKSRAEAAEAWRLRRGAGQRPDEKYEAEEGVGRRTPKRNRSSGPGAPSDNRGGGDVEPENLAQLEKVQRKPLKRPRKKSVVPDPELESVGFESENTMDLHPDELEARRLEKLLFKSSKRQQKKGKSFDWDLEFGGEDDEDGLHYLWKGLSDIGERLERGAGSTELTDQSPDPAETDSADAWDGADSEGTADEEGDIAPGSDQESEPEPRDDELSLQEEEAVSEQEVTVDDRKAKPQDKYVPPAKRAAGAAMDAEGLRMSLSRRMRGVFNRLSNANSESLTKEAHSLLEEYQKKGLARNALVEAFTELLLDSIKDGSGVGTANPFLAAHAAVVVYLHVRSNDAFGAAAIAQGTRRWASASDAGTKDAFGLLCFIAELYHARLVHYSLIYDIIRRLSADMDDRSLEMLVVLVRDVGPSLRRDEPGVLKDIVVSVNEAVEAGQKGSQTQDMPPRVKALVDMLRDVKNTRASGRANQREVLPWLKPMLSDVEPLRVKLDNLLDDEFVARRWWRVGAIRDEHAAEERTRGAPSKRDLSALAAAQGLNTDFRRAVFTALVTAADVNDACSRMGALDLRKARRSDCCRVLLQCCAKEKVYNKFYALVARRLCGGNREMTFALQQVFWDAFRRMDEDPEEWSRATSTTYLNNVSRLLGFMWATGVLNCGVLKASPDLSTPHGKIATFFKLAIEDALTGDQRGSFAASLRELAVGTGFKDPDSVRLPLVVFLQTHFVDSSNCPEPSRSAASRALEILLGSE